MEDRGHPFLPFLEALAEWERSGEEEAMGRAKALALEVLAAWKEAECRSQRGGRSRVLAPEASR